ncbi:MAG: redox-sensing transcriptional repressor Rex [Clostridiales bacterium]|nr:redox-sensing transcriptional repressor Rex [Clostridiales bacterium]
MSDNKISTAVIKRLPRYYRYLGELIEMGVERISSNELSERMKVTASQIRQDLNNFGGFGQQGYGYNVKYLYDEIARILGLDRTHKVVIIGAGNLGRAIAGYGNFAKRGFLITAIFDINPELTGTDIGETKVSHLSELEEYARHNHIDIAALTIPKTQAVMVADRLYKLGVKAFWNFAHTDLNVPQDCVVESVHLSESLMRISYNLKSMEED